MTTLKTHGAIASLVVASMLLFVMFRRGDLFSVTARWFFVVATLQSLTAFVGLTWALERSNTIFYSIFVGDALLRFLALGASVLILNYRHSPVGVPLFCLAGAYLLLSLVQIPFFHRMPLV